MKNNSEKHHMCISSNRKFRDISLPIPRQHVLQFLFHLLTEGGRLQHLHPIALRKQFLTEIEGGMQNVFKVGIIRGADLFLLRVMQRKCTQIIHKGIVCTDNDSLGRLVAAAYHSIVVAEESIYIKIGRLFKTLSSFSQRNGSVQRIDHGAVPFGIFRQQVPPLLEHLDGIRLYGDGIAFLLTEFAISELQLVASLHGIDDGLQKLLTGRDILQHDAVFQRCAFHQHVTHGERIEHPRLQVVLPHGRLAFYVVKVPSLGLAFYVDAEHLLYGLLVPDECLSQHGVSATHSGLHPLLVYFLKGDSFGAENQVDKPDVLSENF